MEPCHSPASGTDYLISLSSKLSIGDPERTRTPMFPITLSSDPRSEGIRDRERSGPLIGGRNGLLASASRLGVTNLAPGLITDGLAAAREASACAREFAQPYSSTV